MPLEAPTINHVEGEDIRTEQVTKNKNECDASGFSSLNTMYDLVILTRPGGIMPEVEVTGGRTRAMRVV